MINEGATELIKMELGGLFGGRVIEDINKLIGLYEVYEKPESWDTFDGEVMDYTPTEKKVNYVKKLIDDQARFMLSETPELIINCEDPNNANIMNEYVQEVLDANLFDSKLVSAGRDCFIGGRVALKINASRIDKSLTVTFHPALEFVFEPSPRNDNELAKIIFFHQMNEETDKTKQRIWKQKYWLENGKCYLTEGVFDGLGKPIQIDFENYYIGLDFIPAYVILNSGLTGDLKGQSDVVEIRDNAKQYNRLTSEDIDTLRKGMNQIIVATDCDPDSLDNVAIKAGALWDIKTSRYGKDNARAVVDTIEANFGYDARMENTLSCLKGDMYDVLSIPYITIEDLKGAVTSGKGLEAIYWKQIIRCKEKFADWRPALQWMVNAIIKVTNEYQIFTLPQEENIKVKCNIRFPLPQDEEQEKQDDSTAVSMQLMSKKRYLMKWYNMTEEEADAELLQIMREEAMKNSVDLQTGVNNDDDDLE